MEVAEHHSVFGRSRRSWNVYALDPLSYRVKESRSLAFQIVMELVAQRHVVRRETNFTCAPCNNDRDDPASAIRSAGLVTEPNFVFKPRNKNATVPRYRETGPIHSESSNKCNAPISVKYL